MKLKDRQTKVIDAIKIAANELKISADKVTRADLINLGLLSDWDMKMVGGLNLVRKVAFPDQEKDLSSISANKSTASYINKLERVVGQKENFEEEIKNAIKNIIKPVKVKTPKIKLSQNKTDREVVVSINDVHYGLIVDPNEVGGVNKFSWVEACRRSALLAQQVVEYKIEKRDQTKRLHVVINGDIIQGLIHDLTARTAELSINQVNGALHILIHFIAYVAQAYPEVMVHGVSGNHDDQPHRRESGKRVTSHKYDSYANMIYYALSAAFRNNKTIKFNFPRELIASVNLIGGRMLVTHGDTLFGKELGNPSSSLNIKGLSNVIARMNSGEIERGSNKYKAVLMGHVHNYVNFTTFDGVKVMVAPSLSGVDPYARSLAINSNEIGQVIFESTKDYVMADARIVSLKEADDNSELDKIIPIYKNELSFSK